MENIDQLKLDENNKDEDNKFPIPHLKLFNLFLFNCKYIKVLFLLMLSDRACEAY